jgi:hypothetical protein
MKILKLPLLQMALAQHGPTIKFIMNEEAIAFFPVSQQHRDVKPEGLSYEDDYKGNALAGLIVSGKPEIRFHSAFSDERVRNLWHQLRSAQECAGLPLATPTYQGRAL